MLLLLQPTSALPLAAGCRELGHSLSLGCSSLPTSSCDERGTSTSKRRGSSSSTTTVASASALQVVNGTLSPPRSGTRPSSKTRAGRLSLELVAGKTRQRRRRRGSRGGGGGDSSDSDGGWWDGPGDGGSGGSFGGSGRDDSGYSDGSGGDWFSNRSLYEATWMWQLLCVISMLNALRFAVALPLSSKKSGQDSVDAGC